MTEVLPETHQLRVELEKRQLEKTDLQQHRDDNTKIEDTESVSTSADKKSKCEKIIVPLPTIIHQGGY